MRVLRHLKKLKADIALLQETHMKAEDYFRLKKLWVGEVYGFLAVGKKGGVLTLIHKKCTYKTEQVDADEKGR